MKINLKIVMVVFLVLGFRAFSQNPYILDNIFDLNLKFKMHQDSLEKMFPVICQKGALDSSFVDVNGRILNLYKYPTNTYPLACAYSNTKLETYLYSRSLSDSLFVFLTFYTKRLIQVDIYYSSDSKDSYVEQKLIKQFGNYHKKMNDKRILAYVSMKRGGFSFLQIRDKGAIDVMPYFCSQHHKNASWEKLEKYVNSSN